MSGSVTSHTVLQRSCTSQRARNDPGAPRGLRLSTHRIGAATAVVQAIGEIDTLTAPYLESHVSEQLHSPVEALVLDLRQVTFLGCSGLSALLAARRAADEAATSLRLVSQSRSVTRALSLVGLADLSDLSSDSDAADGP